MCHKKVLCVIGASFNSTHSHLYSKIVMMDQCKSHLFHQALKSEKQFYHFVKLEVVIFIENTQCCVESKWDKLYDDVFLPRIYYNRSSFPSISEVLITSPCFESEPLYW